MSDDDRDAAHVVSVVYDFDGRAFHTCLRCHYAGFSPPPIPCRPCTVPVSDLDAHFPKRGPCQFCGTGADARHRVIDAVAGAVRAGDDPQDVADDYGITVEAVQAALEVSGE